MRNEILIFSLVGMPGSGKSVAAELINQLGIPVLNMGDVIREEMQKRNIELTRENVGALTREIREREGMDVVARKCMEKITQITDEKLVIDGLRNIEEVQFFKTRLPNFKIIYVAASAEIRYQRLRARGRVDDPANRDEFQERDDRELSFGIQKIIDIANFVVINQGDKEHLKAQLREIIS